MSVLIKELQIRGANETPIYFRIGWAFPKIARIIGYFKLCHWLDCLHGNHVVKLSSKIPLLCIHCGNKDYSWNEKEIEIARLAVMEKLKTLCHP